MKAKLVVVGGDAKAAEIELKLPTVIGRGRGSKLVLPHPLVSRRHCEIFASDGQLVVRDLGSLNGTFVGNERVAERGEAALPPGELLTIGAVTFRAVYGQPDSESPASDSHGAPQPGNETVRKQSVGTVRVAPADDDAAAAERSSPPTPPAGAEFEPAAAANPADDEAAAAFDVEAAEFIDAAGSTEEGEVELDFEEDFAELEDDDTTNAPMPVSPVSSDDSTETLPAPPAAPDDSEDAGGPDGEEDALNKFFDGLN